MSVQIASEHFQYDRVKQPTFDPAAESRAVQPRADKSHSDRNRVIEPIVDVAAAEDINVELRRNAHLQGADRRFENSDLAEQYIEELSKTSTIPISVTRMQSSSIFAKDKNVRWVFVETITKPITNRQRDEASERAKRRANSLLPGVQPISSSYIEQ